MTGSLAAIATPAPAADDWTDAAEALLAEKLAAARVYRVVGEMPSLEHGPVPMHEKLIEVRHKMDAVEVLLDEVLTFRTRARVLLKEAETTVEDKWAERVAAPQPRGRASFDGSFDAAPREKYAKADLAVLSDRRLARRRERLMDACGDAVDQLRLVHRGLDGVRSDLHVLIRGMSVETRLERR